MAFDPSSGNSASISFGPDVNGDRAGDIGVQLREVTGLSILGDANYQDHMTSADDIRSHYAALTIQTNPEDTQRAIDAINSFKTSNGGFVPDYKLYSQNCTTVVRDILNIILNGDTLPTSPDAFWTSIYSKWSNAALTQGQSFQGPIPVRGNIYGQDYGRSRYPINTFNFAWLVLHPDHEKHRYCVGTGEGKDYHET